MRALILSLALLSNLGCCSTAVQTVQAPSASRQAETANSMPQLTTAELAEILQIHFWRVPKEPAGQEWTIEVVPAGPTQGPRRLGVGTALVALRALPDDEYDFVLTHNSGQSSGTFHPCAEPDDAPSICDGYSMEFNDPPACVAECSQAVVAVLTPMVGRAGEKWIVLRLTKSLSIRPGSNTAVTPLP